MGAGKGKAAGSTADHAGRTLAERIEWLVQNRWPADAPAPRTNGEIAGAITAATGEEISSTGFWKLRTGRGANPTRNTLISFTQFFKVPFGFFGDDPQEAEEIGDQLTLLVLLRDKGVSRLQLRSFAGLSGNSRRMILDMIGSAARIEQQPDGELSRRVPALKGPCKPDGRVPQSHVAGRCRDRSDGRYSIRGDGGGAGDNERPHYGIADVNGVGPVHLSYRRDVDNVICG